MDKPTVKVKQTWRHRNGNEYLVLLIANEASTRPEYPVTVVYANHDNATVWARPLSDWHRSFTLVEPAPVTMKLGFH